MPLTYAKYTHNPILITFNNNPKSGNFRVKTKLYFFALILVIYCIKEKNSFNGEWAVLETLDWLIDWF